ncbi:unnamed protein product [Prunus armeniaca]
MDRVGAKDEGQRKRMLKNNQQGDEVKLKLSKVMEEIRFWGKRSDLCHGGGDGLGWNKRGVKAGIGGLSKLGWWFGWLGARRRGDRERERIWVGPRGSPPH